MARVTPPQNLLPEPPADWNAGPRLRRAPGEPIELVALDLDGTLLRSDKQLTKHTARAIHAAQRQGVRIVLATARPPRGVRTIYEALQLDTLVINYNGALIHDPRNLRHSPHQNRHVYHRPLDLELTRRLVAHARKLDPQVVVSLEILDKWYTDHVDATLPTETSRAFLPDHVGPLEAILRTPVTKLMLLAPPQRLAPIHRTITEKFAGQIGVAVSDTHLIQVLHPTVNKGRALAMIAQEYHIPRQRVLAIGDAPNDLGMLRWAGLGLAVANAWDELRAQADALIPSNDADGVAEALKKYVLQ